MKNIFYVICTALVLMMCACSTADFSAGRTINGRTSTELTSANESISSSTSTPEAPTDTPQGDPVPVYNEDIQAFIDAGLQARAIMPPVLERYYYLFSYPEQQEGENTYCVWFEDNISVDLDGDGKDETINIILGDESGNSGIYRDMTIDIDGKQLKLETQDNMFSSFGNGAYVLDIDKNDSKKEIGISGDVWSDMLGYIISFDGKTPKLIFNDFFDIEDMDIRKRFDRNMEGQVL